jgi:hypothetical protein
MIIIFHRHDGNFHLHGAMTHQMDETSHHGDETSHQMDEIFHRHGAITHQMDETSHRHGERSHQMDENHTLPRWNAWDFTPHRVHRVLPYAITYRGVAPRMKRNTSPNGTTCISIG